MAMGKTFRLEVSGFGGKGSRGAGAGGGGPVVNAPFAPAAAHCIEVAPTGSRLYRQECPDIT